MRLFRLLTVWGFGLPWAMSLAGCDFNALGGTFETLLTDEEASFHNPPLLLRKGKFQNLHTYSDVAYIVRTGGDEPHLLVGLDRDNPCDAGPADEILRINRGITNDGDDEPPLRVLIRTAPEEKGWADYRLVDMRCEDVVPPLLDRKIDQSDRGYYFLDREGSVDFLNVVQEPLLANAVLSDVASMQDGLFVTAGKQLVRRFREDAEPVDVQAADVIGVWGDKYKWAVEHPNETVTSSWLVGDNETEEGCGLRPDGALPVYESPCGSGTFHAAGLLLPSGLTHVTLVTPTAPQVNLLDGTIASKNVCVAARGPDDDWEKLVCYPNRRDEPEIAYDRVHCEGTFCLVENGPGKMALFLPASLAEAPLSEVVPLRANVSDFTLDTPCTLTTLENVVDGRGQLVCGRYRGSGEYKWYVVVEGARSTSEFPYREEWASEGAAIVTDLTDQGGTLRFGRFDGAQQQMVWGENLAEGAAPGSARIIRGVEGAAYLSAGKGDTLWMALSEYQVQAKVASGVLEYESGYQEIYFITDEGLWLAKAH